MTHTNFPILWPTITLSLLIFAVWFTLLRQRLAHIAMQKPTPETFANSESVARYFRPVERPARNLANLFEIPVLYFALVPLLMLTNHASVGQIALAWIFVILRALHSLVHIGSNRIRTRMRLYLVSCIVLVTMWIGFGIDLLVHTGRAI